MILKLFFFKMLNNKYITLFQKFIIDLKISIKKRGVQIIRDKKTFFLEILCPILLTLIGLIVSYLKYGNWRDFYK